MATSDMTITVYSKIINRDEALSMLNEWRSSKDKQSDNKWDLFFDNLLESEVMHSMFDVSIDTIMNSDKSITVCLDYLQLMRKVILYAESQMN